MTAGRILDAGTPTGVGSLPFADVAEAVRAELELHPELPAAPQLPRRDPQEGILAQAVPAMEGVELDAGGRLTVNGKRFGAVDAAPLDPAAWAGTLAFLPAIASRTEPIKLQVVGPVTLGLALIDGGARPARAFAVAADAVRTLVQSLVGRATAAAPDAPVMLVLDEPSLTRAMHPGFPLVPEETIDLVSGALASATAAGAAINGIHCCGAVDWSLVLHAGPDLVSMPAVADAVDDAAALSLFLDRGGWIAWGVVPTDRPIGDRHETHWLRLNDVWKGLTAAGCDPVRLRTQALLTPACGLAFHDEGQVPVVMGLVRRVAERVQDQAYAARMSVGA